MKQLIEKYKKQYKDVPEKWKKAVIEKANSDSITYFDLQQDIDWLYDDCLYYLFSNSTRRIVNLAAKMGYDIIPCETARNIIKYWREDEDYMWCPDKAHLFK